MSFKITLEYLKAQQAFSPEVLASLEEDTKYLAKSAAWSGEAIKQFALPVAGLLGVSAVAGGAGYLAAKGRFERHQKDLSESYQTIVPRDGKNLDQFNQRFSELSLISPTIAANPKLALKIIEPRMKKGFDLNDIHRLSAIEYHQAATPKPVAPMHAAKAVASSSFAQGLQMMAPSLAMQLMTPSISREVSKEVNLKLSPRDQQMVNNRWQKDKLDKASPLGLQAGFQKWDRRKQEHAIMKFKTLGNSDQQTIDAFGLNDTQIRDFNLKKQGGAQVSEECLGRMLADRYVMYKTAAPIMDVLRKSFGYSAKEVGEHFKLMAVPLAIAGGLKLVDEVMKGRNQKALHSQADQVFAHMKRTNDYVKNDPELAAEAFDALKSFAPSMAVKPLIARTFVENVIKGGQMNVDTARLLAETQDRIVGNNKGGISGFIEGLKAPMSLFSGIKAHEDPALGELRGQVERHKLEAYAKSNNIDLSKK